MVVIGEGILKGEMRLCGRNFDAESADMVIEVWHEE
jgi:hydroxymethylglutaryl-CoA reductase